MPASVHTYLFFPGICQVALDFYQAALDARVDMVMRYRDNPDSPPTGMIPEGYEDKIMHASFHVGETMIMASDGCGEEDTLSGFSLHLGLASEIDARRYFTALAEGGEVTMPLAKTFWSPLFGMVQDKFGIGWMVCVETTA